MNRSVTAWMSVTVLLGMPIMVEGATPRLELSSSWIELKSGELVGQVGGKPQLMFELRNKTADTAWVQVRAAGPPPNTECVIAKPIAAGANASYACDQEKVVPNVDYSILVTVYRDEGLTDQLEAAQTVMQISKPDADAFAEGLATPILPATFEHVISSEKFTFSTAIFGNYGASGTLVVQESGLNYSNKKRATEIPISQIRGVAIKQLGYDESTMWVVVEYMEGDAVRTLGFQGHPHRAGGYRIAEMFGTISFVTSKDVKAPEMILRLTE